MAKTLTFSDWIEAEAIDAPKLAEMTGFHRTYTWKVLAGKREPSLPFIKKCIEIAAGKLTANSFFEPQPASSEAA